MTFTRSRSLTALALLLAAVLALSPAAWCATTRFELQTSSAQTATSNSGAIYVGGIKEVIIFFDCTASSGTGETLDVFLQASSDGGTNWYDLPFELGMVTDGDATETAGEINARDFVDLAADAACSGVKSVAKYMIFGDYVRVKWFIAGTTPSYTFSVKAIGKN
jgi:hypothetical protein